jgi:hypothetical protein
LHSGEASDWTSVRVNRLFFDLKSFNFFLFSFFGKDSLRYCGAQRIGHGVAIQQNAELEQFIIDRRIPVEVCLTSNLQTKAVSKLNEHPLRRYFDNGMIVVLCTDNPTVSGIRLTSTKKKKKTNKLFLIISFFFLKMNMHWHRNCLDLE